MGKKEVYEPFDVPEITRYLFHPRPETPGYGTGTHYHELSIPVDEGITIGSRFYSCDRRAPVLFFFHGNGEIVADYDDIAQFYQRMNINFLAFDYRGYGKSTGTPSVSTMLQDAVKLFDFGRDYLEKEAYQGPRILMGRSLGSASVLEIVAELPEKADGLIIESGFSFAVPLLALLGIDVQRLGISTNTNLDNHEKIKNFSKPTLIIHAEYDHIIPFSDGEQLFENSADPEKQLLKIPDANHNDILARGLEAYMAAVKELIQRAMALKGVQS